MPTKLCIESHDEPDCGGQAKQTYTLMFNPESFKVSRTVEMAENQAIGNNASAPTVKRIKNGDMSLEFLIDGTGVGLAAAGMVSAVTVTEQVQSLSKTVIGPAVGDMNGKTVPYCRVVWGCELFLGVLKNMDVTYILFDADGAPLRAKVNLVFAVYNRSGNTTTPATAGASDK